MATNQLSKNYQVEGLTNFVIEKGSKVVKSSAAFVSKLTVTQRIAAAVTLLTSMWLFSLTNLWSGTEDPSNQSVSSPKKGTQSRLRRLKVVRFFSWITGGFLKLIENAISPKGPVRVGSQQKLPIIMSDEVDTISRTLSSNTPTNNLSNEASRAPSCASLIEDLSQSTITTPIRNARLQVASKLRTWRLALQDECDGRTGYYELHHINDVGQKKSSSWFERAWRAIFGSGADENEFGAVQELRKRKRPEGDDYLALYVPLTKGVHRLDEADSRHIFSAKEDEAPGIRGLSIVPIIGNWYSAERLESESDDRIQVNEQLDNISLIQRDVVAPSKQNLEETSDGEQYEILDMETRNSTPPCVETNQ